MDKPTYRYYLHGKLADKGTLPPEGTLPTPRTVVEGSTLRVSTPEDEKTTGTPTWYWWTQGKWVAMPFATVADERAAIAAATPEPLADVWRFFRDDREKELVLEAVPISEAKEHCSAPYTEGDGWFDGFESH